MIGHRTDLNPVVNDRKPAPAPAPYPGSSGNKYTIRNKNAVRLVIDTLLCLAVL